MPTTDAEPPPGRAARGRAATNPSRPGEPTIPGPRAATGRHSVEDTVVTGPWADLTARLRHGAAPTDPAAWSRRGPGPDDRAGVPTTRLQRWRYQGRRHRQRILAQHRTAMALGSTAGAALLLVLAVALWPAPRRSTVLPEPPRRTAPLSDERPGGGSGGAADPSASAGTPSVAAPPPPPTQPVIPSSGPATPGRPAPKPPPARIVIPVSSFEAESAANTLDGPARIFPAREASGGLIVGDLGRVDRGFPGTLRIEGLTVPAAGTYTLTIFYLAGDGDRAATITINGTVRALAFPDTGDRSTVGSLTTRVDLAAGANSVEFSNPVNPAPGIDRVTLGP